MKPAKALLSAALVVLGLLVPARSQAESPEAMRQIDEQIVAWLEQLEANAENAALSQRSSALSASSTLVTRAGGIHTCLPTCDTRDGQFLSIAGTDLQTLAGDRILLRVLVPAGEASFTIGIFDGDSGGAWDLTQPRAPGVPLEYTLIVDPDGDGVGPVMGVWDGSTMPDDAWFEMAFATGADAQLPSGTYSYLLQIRSTDFFVPNNWSNFKIRTSGSLSTSITVSPVAFAFTGPLFSAREGNILYPNASVGDLTTTTYDGTWRFFLEAFETPTFLELWDGDLDRGAANQPLTYDTDDPDTPNAPFLPGWADPTGARPEGVAFVITCGSERSATGCPADDRANASLFRRSPSIEFTLTDPNGVAYRNANPSGNREWEQFKVSTAPFDPTQMDYSTISLPPGIYEVRADGVDLSNLNAWRFFDAVLGVCEDGTPCVPLPRPYLVGDTVWFDVDGDGIQDPGEPGIAGVVVNLVDSAGHVIASATTDADGLYTIGVEAGVWTVEVDASSFKDGAPLAGLSTTTGNVLTFTVVDDNVLTYDFGYNLGSQIVECNACEGKVSSLTFLFNGSAPAEVTITGRRGADKATPLFSGMLLPGEIFTVGAPASGNGGFAGTLGTEIAIYVDGALHAEVHTSCSLPIGPGLVAGDFEVLAGESKYGGALCPLDGGDDGGGGEPPLGTGTLGYWKNHSEAWPVDTITVGGLLYSKGDALALLGTSSKGDKTYDLFHQLVPAILNVLIGNESSCIDSTLAAADDWLAAHPVGSQVKAKQWGTSGGEDLHDTLDDYNNGRLCAPHRT